MGVKVNAEGGQEKQGSCLAFAAGSHAGYIGRLRQAGGCFVVLFEARSHSTARASLEFFNSSASTVVVLGL